MAFDPQILMSIQDSSGNYYTANLQQNGTYNVSTTSIFSEGLIAELPNGWDDIKIQWERDSSYKGIFRSMVNSDMRFTKATRAILQHIHDNEGVQGYGKFSIYLYNNDGTSITYPVYYSSKFDFTTYKDDMFSQSLSIGVIDSDLIRDIHAFGDTDYNIPFWLNIGTSAAPVWVVNGNANFIVHDGIKLLYQQVWTGAASPPSTLGTTQYGPITYQIGGFNWSNGWDFNSGVIGGIMTFPTMQPYNIVQANGATTFIGNDILQPQLPVNAQMDWININAFVGNDTPRFYTTGGNLIKNALVTTETFEASIQVSATFAAFDGTVQIVSDSGFNNFLGFVLLAINANDKPDNYFSTAFGKNIVSVAGNGSSAIPSRSQLIDYIDLGNAHNYVLPVNPATPDRYIWQSQIKNVTLYPNTAYALMVVYDNYASGYAPFDEVLPGGSVPFSENCHFTLIDLSLTLKSHYNSGSAAPVPAPKLNPSVFPAMRLNNLFELIVKSLPTRNSDNYGFPVPVNTPYEFYSDFLTDPTLNIGDCCPNQIWLTSQYAIHDLQGNPYITGSFNKLFDFCFKMLGAGGYIQYDSNGDPTIFRLERLRDIFDNSTMILDLGYDITEFKIEALTEGMGANLKLGYEKANTNSDFGVDPFITELYYNTPLSNVRSTIDIQETTIIAEQYAIEKIRAQHVNQPIGQGYDPANPSTDNQLVALYCKPTNTVYLPQSSSNLYDINPYDPSNNPVPCFAYQLNMHSDAQNSDPTAASKPYIYGMYYPDTAYNLELSPCRALKRDTGAWMHSMLYGRDSDSLVFRNTAVIQYNNTIVDLSGIESNLEVGASAPVVTEFKDIPINTLPAPLFRPRLLKVKTKYPVNIYQILRTNPNGYVRFFAKNDNGAMGYTEYRGFIRKVFQSVVTGAPSDIELIEVPSY
jgi:hypothetical protein